MNTLLFTLEYPPFKGGVANYYGNIVKHWPQAGKIIVLDNNENKLLREFGYPKWKPALYELAKIARQQKIDYVLVGQILPLGIPAYFLSKFFKFKYGVFLHGADFTYAMRVWRKKIIARLILKGAQSIICTNSYVKNLAEKFLGNQEKIYLVNPGVNINENKLIKGDGPNSILRNDKIILFSIGRLVRRKGFDMVIKAMPEILKSVPNIIYIIAGTGPDEEYLKNLSKGYEDKIKFLGEISDEEKWTYLKNCDIFITVSRNIDGDFEGFGIVYLEANLAGKPVIAGDTGGVRDAVIPNKTGLLVNPNNTEEIARAVIKLADSKEIRNKLGEQGKQRVLDEFSWQDKVRKIYNIIN